LGLGLLLLREAGIERGFRLVKFSFQIARIEFGQKVAGFHLLIVGNVNLKNVT
jgi:hypothetical protein